MIDRVHRVIICVFSFVCMYFLHSSVFALTLSNPNICTQIQCVKIQKGYLWVLSSDNVNYVPYFVKAVGYQPTPIGRYPSDWGYAPGDPRSINNNIYDDPNILNRDFSLLQQMNANTIRIWGSNKLSVNGRFLDYMTNASTTANADTTQNTLDLASSYGIKVIAGFWVNYLIFDANNNISSVDNSGNPLTRQAIINNFVNFVNTYKGNRAILFWAIGNENNYQSNNASPVTISAFENAFGQTYGDTIFNWLRQRGNFLDYNGDVLVDITSPGYVNILKQQYPLDYNAILNVLAQFTGQGMTSAQLASWYNLVDAMSQAAHKAEGATFHPVAIVNGEIGTIGNSADGSTDAQLPDLDIWGANVYRGQSFGTLFTNYAKLSHKPLWISEFGVDSWSVSNGVDINNWGGALSADLGGTGSYNPNTQSAWDIALWGEISNNAPITVGGSVMEYSDEWWKPTEFYCTSPNVSQAENAITAGICNANHKYFGFPSYAMPDDFSNEEWYGVMSISPNPVKGDPDIMTARTVYNGLQAQWQTNPWPTVTLDIEGSGTGLISSSSTFGPGLNCNFVSGSSTGICSTALTKNQPVTLNFSSPNKSTVTYWGYPGCSNKSTACQITPSADIPLYVTISPPLAPTVILNSNSFSYVSPASVYLSAFALESGGTISKVEFYNGTSLIHTSSSSIAAGPYSDFVYVWNNSTPGNYRLTAKAYDNKNNVTVSSPATFTISGLPTVSLAASSSSNNAPATITLTAKASEMYGSIRQVSFYSGRTFLGTSFTSPYTFVWKLVPAGNYELLAAAYDNNNQMVVSSVLTVSINPAALLKASVKGKISKN